MTPDFSIEGSAQRICIYIGEGDRWRGRPLYAAILETLKTNGIAGATVVRGVAGFGAHSRIHTASILRLSEDLPLRLEVIDTPEKIVRALELVSPMVREGLITLDEVQVIRYTHRYLNPLPADKPVSEVMTTEVFHLSPDMSIAQAWEHMLAHLIKAMPVVTSDGQVVGMLTDEDLICCAGVQQRLSVAERMDAAVLHKEMESLRASTLTVAEVMSKPPITALASEPLGVAAARMAKNGVKRLPVLDEQGKLVGVLSRVDVLQQVLETGKKSRKSPAVAGAVQTVGQVMSPEIPLVHLDADLAEIVQTLLETGSRRLIVVNALNQPIGLISDGDVVGRIQPLHKGRVLEALRRLAPPPSSQDTAEQLMSPGVLTLAPDTPVVEAVREMLAQQRKWLVVVDEQGKALGLVDRQILLRAITTP